MLYMPEVASLYMCIEGTAALTGKMQLVFSFTSSIAIAIASHVPTRSTVKSEQSIKTNWSFSEREKRRNKYFCLFSQARGSQARKSSFSPPRFPWLYSYSCSLPPDRDVFSPTHTSASGCCHCCHSIYSCSYIDPNSLFLGGGKKRLLGINFLSLQQLSLLLFCRSSSNNNNNRSSVQLTFGPVGIHCMHQAGTIN